MQRLTKVLVITALVLLCILTAFLMLHSAEIAIIVLITVFFTVATFIDPFIGAMFYLICLYIRPFEILPILRGIPVMKLVAITTLAVWLLRTAIYRKRTFVKAPQNLLIIGLLVILMASNRTYIHGMLDAFSEFSKIVIIYFLLTNLITNRGRMKVAVWIVILSTSYLALQGVLLSKGISIGGVEFAQGTSRIRGIGIFGDPNDLAMTLVVGIPFTFFLFFSKCSTIERIILVTFGCLMSYCILLTGSRGGIIGFSIVILLLLRSRIGTFTGAAFTVVILAILLTLAPSYTLDRMRNISAEEGTGASRIDLWYEGWQMFLSNPILGVGMHNYNELATGYQVAHNSFMHIAAETGIIGLFIWIGLFYFSFKCLMGIAGRIDEAKRVSYEQPITDSLKVSLIGFIVCAFFLSRQYQYVPYILIALSVSVYDLCSRQNGSIKISIKDATGIAGMTLGFIVFWYMILRIFA